jgi:phosphonate transport system substrate-binding protein
LVLYGDAHRRQRYFSRRALLCSFVGLLGASARAAKGQEGFSFGLTPVVLDKDRKLLTLLQTYLTTQLERPAVLINGRSQRETVEMLHTGQLDAAWICDLAYVQNKDTLTALAVPLYRNQPLDESYIIVNEASAAQSLDDLRGSQHAFSDPDTASGYFITCRLLGLRHETPASFFRNYFFTYGHRNTIRAVAAGLAESGSVEGYIWELMRQREPVLVNRTRVVYRSEPLGFPPVVVSTASLRSPATRALKTALLNMRSTSLGPDILSILALDGFTTPSLDLYADIAEKWRLARAEELRAQE